MGSNVIDNFDQALNPLYQCKNISSDLINDLQLVLYKLHQQKSFSKPMPWIGMFIALASLCCVLGIVADFLHSWQNHKTWIPCKYFTLNAVSLTVIAVAMKLPMDLTSPMPGIMDQKAKLGSLAFMCIMMALLLPSLATMNGKELVKNIIALGVLVITLVVNVCIQINTGLLYNRDAITHVAVLLILLIIYICSALMILKSKEDLESKYQAAHESQQQAGQLTVENLKQRVINYGIMAETGSPQLMTVFSATSIASAVIGFSISILDSFLPTINCSNEIRYKMEYDSDYKWSILAIVNMQSIEITVGGLSLLYRFCASFAFKVYAEGIWNLIKFYEVESSWTHTLSDWQHNRLYSSSSPNFKIVFYKLQILGLTLLELFQKAIVITCKALMITPFVLLCICVDYFLAKPPLRQPEPNRDIHQYVVQLQDTIELADLRTLDFIIKYVERSIQNAEKQQPSKLLKLLENSRDFEGVKRFDILPVQSLPGLDNPSCWSLPVVTLTTIALSLHKIQPGALKNFLNGVNEGLVYVKLVEESLNNKEELVIVQKAAERLWLEVEVYHKWLGNNLQNPDFRVKTAIQIVKWFKEKATNMVNEVGSMGICANSMRRITHTILIFNQDNIDEVSQEELFDELSSMISDILAACLTNLPQVIALKCYTSAIEKRGESVDATATLLGKTSVIINTLQARALTISLTPEEFPFIDKWRDHLTAPAP